MARKKAAPKLSKSAAIREYSGSHGSAKPKEIAEALTKSGYAVTPQYVSMILSNDRKKAGKPKRTRRTKAKSAKPKATNNQQLSMDDLLAAKQLIQATGTLATAKAALDAYADLVSSK